MNRILSRILAALLLWPFALFGQTAQVQSVEATGTCTTPATSVTFTAPKAGQTVIIKLPANTGTATVTVPAQTATVNLSGYRFTWTIDFSKQFLNPDGTTTGVILNLQTAK